MAGSYLYNSIEKKYDYLNDIYNTLIIRDIYEINKLKDEKLWDNLPEQNKFLEAMADAASSVHKIFKGNIVYINVMYNMSVDCDCCAVAEDPYMKDVGIIASTDPIAVDQACIDIIYNSKDPGRDHFVERVERQKCRLVKE